MYFMFLILYIFSIFNFFDDFIEKFCDEFEINLSYRSCIDHQFVLHSILSSILK